MKLGVLSLALGSLVTLLTLLFPYAYCHNGRARGLPLAGIIPGCEATPLAFGMGYLEGVQVVDVPRMAGNVVLWSGLSFGVLGWAANRRRTSAHATFLDRRSVWAGETP
jgi:hypothetical protein